MASIFAKFFGRTVSEAAGFAAGVATGPVLSPVVEEVRQLAWSEHAVKTLEPELAAEVAAEDVDTYERMADEAKRHGFDGTRFADLYGLALNAPGIGPLFEAYRRDLIGDAAFVHGLRKAKLEPRWDGPLMALKERLLAPDVLANARQQGFVDVARQHEESALQGIDTERADVLFELSGNPPGPQSLQAAYNRGLIDRATFDQAIREGRTKTKYTDLEFAMRRRLLTPHEYEEAALRGIMTRAEADAGAALSGLEPEDAALLFEIMGRPLAVRQITTGLARGGTFGGTYADVPEPYRDAIRRSNIRPEYARLAYANRYSYPSAFVLRSLAQAGELGDEAAVQTILEQIGWPPELAAKVAPSWVGGGTTGDTHVSKAQTQLWSTTHRSYVNDRIDATAATAALGSAGVPAASIPDVLATWNAERDLIRAGLSAAQIKKAYRENAFTVDEAVARLVELGWSVADAQTFLPL